MNFINLGIIDFKSAVERQYEAVEQVRSGADDMVLFCQHSPSCIVLGRNADRRNILRDEVFLASRGIHIASSQRGGDVTLHNSGQLLAYPILDLNRFRRDIRWYLDMLEICVCKLLKGYGIDCSVRGGNRGVWVKHKKICSIGISIRHWITFFGFALNINNDLSQFSFIRPCGQDIEMTSLQRELGKVMSMERVILDLEFCFSSTFRRFVPRMCL